MLEPRQVHDGTGLDDDHRGLAQVEHALHELIGPAGEIERRAVTTALDVVLLAFVTRGITHDNDDRVSCRSICSTLAVGHRSAQAFTDFLDASEGAHGASGVAIDAARSAIAQGRVSAVIERALT